MDIQIKVRADKLMELLDLDNHSPEEYRIESAVEDGEVFLIFTLIDC